MMFKKNILLSKLKALFFAQKRRNKIFILAVSWLVLMFTIGLFAPFIANNKPYYIRVFNHSYYPLFYIHHQIDFYDELGNKKIIDCQQMDWKHLPFEKAIFPSIAYSPNTSDIINADYKAPNDEQNFITSTGKIEPINFRFKHYLGTNKRGEDVCSGLIHGASISLIIGISAMLIAAFIGIFVGLIAGYFGNNKLKMKRGSFYFLMIGLAFAWFYGFQLQWFNLANALSISIFHFLLQILISFIISLLVLWAFYFFAEKTISRFSFFSTSIFVPVDSIVVKIIEIIVSLPIIILVISIAAISKPSFYNLILIISLVQWTSIARLIRAEMQKIKTSEFIQAAKILGINHFGILLKHALPNVISPVIISLSLGVAQAILIESSLSFLGVGLPTDVVSWGSLISAGCENFHAWWLVVFPGICIFGTILSFNIIGDSFRRKDQK
ncbi:MAG: hypothetical protein RL065_1161 [Bacteroidota bacterium]